MTGETKVRGIRDREDNTGEELWADRLYVRVWRNGEVKGWYPVWRSDGRPVYPNPKAGIALRQKRYWLKQFTKHDRYHWLADWATCAPEGGQIVTGSSIINGAVSINS